MRLQKEKAFPPSFHATKRNLPPFIFFVGNPHLPPRIPLCSMIAHTLINIFFHIVYCLSLSLSFFLSQFTHTDVPTYNTLFLYFSVSLFLSFCLSFTHTIFSFFLPLFVYMHAIFISMCPQYSLLFGILRGRPLTHSISSKMWNRNRTCAFAFTFTFAFVFTSLTFEIFASITFAAERNRIYFMRGQRFESFFRLQEIYF